MKTILTAWMLLVIAAPAWAQASEDTRWTPWLGCWELVIDDVRAAPDQAAAPGRAATPGAPEDQARPQVCITSTSGGATFTTSVAGEQPLVQTTVADATDRPVDDAGCRGTQRAEWSADGTRLYANAQVTCAGESSPRRVSGLALLGPDGRWLDVQAVEVGGRENIRLRRYRRLAEAGATAPVVTATRLTLADVKEASRKISPRAVEAALVETKARFDLSGRTLIELDESGVPGSIVDVMVALSYPDRFVVERNRDDRAGTVFINDPFFHDYGFSPFGDFYYSPYYYSPFGYSYLGRFSPFVFGGGYIVVDGGGGGSVEPRPTGAGRVVDGLGYTRVRSREPEAATSTGQRSTSSSSGGAASGSSSSSGGASSQGSSGSGSGGDTGRTAVPR